MNDVFQRLQSTAKAGKFSAKASFLEIYNETHVDLLNPQTSVSMKLNLYEDKHGIRVEGLTERKITSAADALQVLREGGMRRTTASTLMNSTSHGMRYSRYFRAGHR